MAEKSLPLLEFSSTEHAVLSMFVLPKLPMLELPMVLEFSSMTMTIMSNTMGVMASTMGHMMSAICCCCSGSTPGEHSCYTVP